MQRPDRHNEVEINLLKSGSLSYLLGGRRTTVKAERFAVFWAAVPHQIVAFEGDSPYFVVTLPLSDFLGAELEKDFVSRILHGELLMDAGVDKTDQLKFQQWEEELKNDDPTVALAARLEVRARLVRLARIISDRPNATHPTPKLSRADQLACFIARNYQQPLTSQTIAKANGAHPNYAMNLFRQTFGTTMTHFITEHRISHAAVVGHDGRRNSERGAGIRFSKSEPLQRSFQGSLRLLATRLSQSTSHCAKGEILDVAGSNQVLSYGWLRRRHIDSGSRPDCLAFRVLTRFHRA